LLIDWHRLRNIILLDIVDSLRLLEDFEMVGIILFSLLLILHRILSIMRHPLWSLNHWPLRLPSLELPRSLLRGGVYLIKELFKFGFALSIQENCRFIIIDILLTHEGSLIEIDFPIFGR
jgi:hypothetical protein